jgi:anti-sigma B factor antagonist
MADDRDEGQPVDTAGAPLRVERRHRGDVVVLGLRGELDLGTIRVVRSALAPYLAEGATVELDLSGLDLLDSSGLQFLVTAYKAARADGWTLRVVPPAGRASQALVVSGLDGVLPLVDGG